MKKDYITVQCTAHEYSTNMGAIWWGTRGKCPPHFLNGGT